MSPFLPRWVGALLVLATGALLMRAVPDVLESLAAPDVPALWWASRAFGLLAYAALWLSALFGVFVAGRGAGDLLDRATVMDLHTRWALAAQVATVLHVLAAVAEPVSGVSPLSAVIPFASARLRGPVALGTFALWGLALVAGTTVAMQRLPRWAWRAVHASAFGTLLLALVHGLAAGTDTQAPLVRGLYAGTIAVLLGAVLQRALLARHDTTRAGAGPGARSEPTRPTKETCS